MALPWTQPPAMPSSQERRLPRTSPRSTPLQAHNAADAEASVARRSANGSPLIFSTYLGGSGGDYGNAIAVNPTTGDALVLGAAYSTNFPTASPLQAYNAGDADAFVARLS